jgi:hypothetical protein
VSHSKPRRLVALAGIATVLAGIVYFQHRRTLDFAFAWPAGEKLRYSLRWSKEDRATLPPSRAPMVGSFDLDATLTLRSYGFEDGHWLVGAQLERIDRAHFAVDDRELIDEAATAGLRRSEAMLLVTSTGAVDQVLLPRDADELWKSTMQALASELEVIVEPRASSWTRTQRDALGSADVSYRVLGAASLSRRRTHYRELRSVEAAAMARSEQQISDDGRVELDGGHLSRLDDERQTRIGVDGVTRLDARAQLHLRLVAVERGAAAERPPLAELETRNLGVATLSPSARADLLRQRIGDMTTEELLADLTRAGAFRDNAAWLWHASGLLIGHPELCAQLAERFAASRSTEEHALILDLLASAGHHEAQLAMRAALGSDAATRDPAYGLLLQRFSAVARPEPESAAFLADHARAGDHDLARASLYALGATTGRLGDASETRRYNDVLVEAYRAAKQPAERAAALRALGNAGLTDDVPLAVAALGASDVEERAAATAALRHVVTPETTAALLDRVADPAAPVGAEALSALAARPLDDAELDRIAAAVDSASRETDGLVVNLAASRLASSPNAAALLERVLAKTDDPSLQARIRTLLHRVGRDS